MANFYGYDTTRDAGDSTTAAVHGGVARYVATGGVNSGAGTIGSPWATLNYASANCNAGDTIYVRGGTYTQTVTWTKDGTSSNPIEIRSYPGEWAVFDGSGLVNGDDSGLFFLSSCSYVIIRSIEARDYDSTATENSCGFLATYPDHLSFINCYSHGNRGVGFKFYRGSRGTTSCRFENCTSYNNFDDHNAGSAEGDNADGFECEACDGNTYYRCVAHYNSDDGFDGNYANSNTWEQCVAYQNGRGAGGDGNGFKMGWPGNGGNTVIRCISLGNRRSGFSTEYEGGTDTASTVKNCLSYDQQNLLDCSPATVVTNFAHVGSGDDYGEFGGSITATTCRGGSFGGTVSSADFESVNFADLNSTTTGQRFFYPKTPNVIDQGTICGLTYAGAAPDIGAVESSGGGSEPPPVEPPPPPSANTYGTGTAGVPSYVTTVTGGGAKPSTSGGYVLTGAVGDGNTDDTAALNASADAAAAAGKVLIVPAPSNYYRVSGMITLHGSVVGVGYPLIKRTSTTGTGTSTLLFTNYTGSGMWITGLRLDGGWDPTGQEDSENEWAMGIDLRDPETGTPCRNITIEDCWIGNVKGDCIYLGSNNSVDGGQPYDEGGTANILINSNHLINPFRCLIGFIHTNGCVVTNNVMEKKNTFVEGLDFEPNEAPTQQAREIEIAYNTTQVPDHHTPTGGRVDDDTQCYVAQASYGPYGGADHGGSIFVHDNGIPDNYGSNVSDEPGFFSDHDTWQDSEWAQGDNSHGSAIYVWDNPPGSGTSPAGNLPVGGVVSTCAAPTFSPAAGSYASAQSVTISCATSGASIRYTTDGSAPTSGSGTVYAGAISVASTTTIRAIAYKAGFVDSVTSAQYRIGATPPGGLVALDTGAQAFSALDAAATVSVDVTCTSAAGLLVAVCTHACSMPDEARTATSTVSGAGLTWQRRARYATSIDEACVEVWSAPLSGVLSAEAITWTYGTGTGVQLHGITCYPLSSASGVVGASAGQTSATGSALADTLATGVGSFVVFGAANGTSLAPAWHTNTVADVERLDAVNGAAIGAGHLNGETSGATVTVGWSNAAITSSQSASCAVEFLASPVTPGQASVTLTPATASVQAGRTVVLTAEVAGSASAVTWTVQSGSGTLSGSGGSRTLTTTTAGTIVVRAALTDDAAVYDESTVTVTAVPSTGAGTGTGAGASGQSPVLQQRTLARIQATDFSAVTRLQDSLIATLNPALRDLVQVNDGLRSAQGQLASLEARVANAQANSSAADLAALIADFNALLQKLRDAGLMGS